jgi:ABC-2 type transport system ATP-binding protein
MKIEIRDLVVRYDARPQRAPALDGVGFTVETGAVFALLGRNGSGKSTLVRTLLGQRRPDAGTVRVDGLDPWHERARLMARLGATPELPDAPPALAVTAIERWTAPLYPRWDHAAFAARLTRFEVPPQARFGELSRGQKALVSLALALAPRPELLVLDDPTLGLDVVARRSLSEELIGELADRGTTVFLTTHDLSGFEGILTHAAILKEGRLVLDEEMDTLKSRFRRIRYANRITETRTVFGNELDAFDAVRVQARGWGIDAVVSNFRDEAFEQFLTMDGIEDAEAAPMSLEEIFVAVAGEGKGVAA